MFTNPNYKILNQSIDFIFGEVKNENLFGEFTSRFRKTIFENETFLLRESREKIIGVHAEGNGAGISLVQKEESWVLNFGFSKMSVIEIGDMLSGFKPMEKMLKDLCEEVGVSLDYLHENNGSSKKDRNSFLKEMVIIPSDTLVVDKVRRLFQIKNYGESTVYTINSLNGELSSLNDCAELLQNEEINAEEVFIPSLSHWLNCIKSPELVPSQEDFNSRAGHKNKYKN